MSDFFGQRYVFFSSLLNTSYKGADYYKYGPNLQLGLNAETHFSRHLTYNKNNIKDSKPVTEFEMLITNFIAQLTEWAENEAAAERNYIIKMRSVITNLISQDSIPEGQKEELKKVLAYFPQNDNTTWKYAELSAAFTSLRTNAYKYINSQANLTDELKQQKDKLNQSDIMSRTFEVSVDYDTLEFNVQKTLKELAATDYGQYNKQFFYSGLKSLQTSVATRINDRADKALRAILASNKLHNIVLASFQQGNQNGNSKNFNNQLRDWIYNLATLNEYSDYRSLKNDVIEQAKKNTSWATVDFPETAQFLNRLKPSLERALLISSNQTMAILESFFDANSKTFNNDFQRQYGSTISKQVANLLVQLHNTTTQGKTIKNKIYAILRSELERKYLNNLGLTYNAIKQRYKSIKDKAEKEQYIENILITSGIQPLYTTVLKSLKVTSFKDYSVAELEQDVKNVIRPVIADAINAKGRVYGKVIQLKNDAVWSVNFSPLQPSQVLLESGLAANLESKTSSLINDFMVEYNKKSGGKTDIPKASAILKSHLEKLSSLYQAAQQQLQDDQKKQEELESFIDGQAYNQISVKEYKLYNDEIGFKGGSLGKDYNAVESIEQIQAMYDTGGISQLDTNLLVEAVLNSSPDTILSQQNNDVLTNVKNYLLGGAVMAMFDAGFVNTKTWLEMRQQMLTPEGGPMFVNLFVFEGRYVPASLLLKSIVNQLKQLYNTIETEAMEEQVNSSIVIENYITNEHIPDYPDTMERWNNVSQIAQENTKLYILLAAGLLDIFSGLENIFANVQA